MHTSIFKIIQNALEAIGRKTGFTYNEVNIIVYFFAIPFSWLCLLDVIFGGHWGKTAFIMFTLGFMAGCRAFKKYADWLFDQSVAFRTFSIGLAAITWPPRFGFACRCPSLFMRCLFSLP